MTINISIEIIIIWASLFVFSLIWVPLRLRQFKKELMKIESVMYFVNVLKEVPSYNKFRRIIWRSPFTITLYVLMAAPVCPLIFLAAVHTWVRKRFKKKPEEKQPEIPKEKTPEVGEVDEVTFGFGDDDQDIIKE